MEKGMIEKIKRFAEISLKDLDSAHGIKPALITTDFAKIIAEKENAPVDLCVIAALLHDIGRSVKLKKETIENNHGIDSAKKAEKFLLSLGMKESEVREICRAISTHCFPNIQKTKISKILWDSDKLNVFSKEMNIEQFKFLKKLGMSDEQVEKDMQIGRNFYIKNFHTKTAKEILNNLNNNY